MLKTWSFSDVFQLPYSHRLTILILTLHGSYFQSPYWCALKQQAFIIVHVFMGWLNLTRWFFCSRWYELGLQPLSGDWVWHIWLTHISDAFVVSAGRLASTVWFFGLMWYYQGCYMEVLWGVNILDGPLNLAGSQQRNRVGLLISECLSFSPCGLVMWHDLLIAQWLG